MAKDLRELVGVTNVVLFLNSSDESQDVLSLVRALRTEFEEDWTVGKTRPGAMITRPALAFKLHGDAQWVEGIKQVERLLNKVAP